MDPERTGTIAAASAPARRSAARASDLVSVAPLGIPLHIELGPGVDADAVRAACRGWEGPAEHGEAPIRLRLERDPGLSGTSEPRILVEGRGVRVTGPGAEGRARVDARAGRCEVSDAWFAAPDRLRDEVLEPLVLFVLAHHDRTPIHASAFIAGDVAILTSGSSGAGKSSLALAADRAGWPVLSDDTVYLQQQRRFRIWGFPHAAHLLPRDCDDAAATTRTRNGQVKRAVPFRATKLGMVSAERATLCVLKRGSRVALEPLDAAEAIRRLGPLEPGFDLFARESAEALAFLTANGAWLLTLSEDPSEAIALLAANLPRLHATAAPQ